MIEAGPFGPQGHSLSFFGLGLRFWLWFWRQRLFLSIHLAAGQVSELSPYPRGPLSADPPAYRGDPFWFHNPPTK